MDYLKLANLLYPNVTKTPEDYFKMYPERNLPKGAEVTRTAPSPTGFFHTGTLYGAMIDKLTAQKTNGVFYLRIEDTDQKRKIEGAAQVAFDMLCKFNTSPDEGFFGEGEKERGDYGPYVQSKRLDIYNAFAKRIVELGHAFPCFCKQTEGKEDVKARRKKQLEETGEIIDHDPCRDLDFDTILKNINDKKTWALKLRSNGDPEKTFKFFDLIKGERELHENCKDIVLMKSNGIPPYAFAHLVDDTLMHTTIVVRGEEWWPSLNAHLELFKVMGIKPPKYAHTPVICKLDEATGNKRKLSKRYDPEADTRYFVEKGYPSVALNEYLLNLLNSDFENWRKANPSLAYTEFPFSIKKVSSNNPMFDLVKINDISKNLISRIPAKELCDNVLAWAKEYDKDFAEVILRDREYLTQILTIDRDGDRPRKDISHYGEVKDIFSYMFDEYFVQESTLNIDPNLEREKVLEFLKKYKDTYKQVEDKNVWFENLKEIAFGCGFASTKDFKAEPEKYVGSIADASNIVRVAMTGKTTTPDLFSIMSLLHEDKVKSRLDYVLENLK